MLALSTYYGKTKILSLSCLLTPMLLEALFRHSFPSVDTIELCLYCATSVILLLPLSCVNELFSFIEAAALSVVVFVLRILKVDISIILLLMMLTHIVNLIYDARKSFFRLQNMIRNKMIGYYIERSIRFMSCIILFFLGFFFLLSKRFSCLTIPSILILLAFYVLYCVFQYLDRCYLLTDNEESEFRRYFLKKVNDDPAKMERTEERLHKGDFDQKCRYFEKLEKMMREERIFLDKSLSLNDISQRLYTNKTYMSNVVNTVFGDSFPNYVHKYRIDYAMGLLRKDPNLKVDKLANLSGYNSPNLFSQTFKRINGITPKQFADNVRYDQARKEGLSSQKEPEP